MYENERKVENLETCMKLKMYLFSVGVMFRRSEAYQKDPKETPNHKE